MEISSDILVGCFLVLIAVHSSHADLEVKSTPNIGLDEKNPKTLNDKNNKSEKLGGSDQVLDARIKMDRDQVERSKKDVQNEDNKSNSSKKGESKEAHNVKTEEGNVNGVVPVKEGGRKGNSGKGLVSKERLKENNDGGTSVNLTPLRKENDRGEECDMSNRCTDEEKKLVACLRVPGNDSPDLSLLIQNKGKGPLAVAISAPDYVQLEKTKIQLQEKQNKKVKVSIRHGGTDNVIILTAGNGRCNLDFGDLIAHDSSKETDTAPKFKYIIFLTRNCSIAFLSLAGLLIVASAWMCVSFWRRHFHNNGSKYQKLETELPVSGGEKMVTNTDEGWDNSWDDKWDDEEAPKTPSMPVTPSLSSKGLAPRRFNKEGWKD